MTQFPTSDVYTDILNVQPVSSYKTIFVQNDTSVYAEFVRIDSLQT